MERAKIVCFEQKKVLLFQKIVIPLRPEYK